MSTEDFNREVGKLDALFLAFALHLTNNQDRAQLLMREAMVRAHNYRNEFTYGDDLSARMADIMWTTYTKLYGREPTVDHVKGEIGNQNPKLFILKQAERDVRRKELIRLLAGVGEHYSVPYLLFYQGCSFEEIANRLNISVSKAKKRVFIARHLMIDLTKKN